jgi:hypothetical protein
MREWWIERFKLEAAPIIILPRCMVRINAILAKAIGRALYLKFLWSSLIYSVGFSQDVRVLHALTVLDFVVDVRVAFWRMQLYQNLHPYQNHLYQNFVPHQRALTMAGWQNWKWR